MSKEAPKLITEAQIYSEIDAARSKNGGLSSYFNNLHSRLPGQYSRELSRRLDILDKTPLEAGLVTGGMSELRQNQTYRDFHDTIDTVLKSEGLDLDEIRQQASSRHPDLYEVLIPAYVKLRLMGYYHYPDLTA